MRKIGILIASILLFAALLCITCHALVAANTIAEAISKAIPCDFGYLDNTKYQMQCFFSDMTFVDDSCIMVCSDSKNFNEFGVFHVKNNQEAEKCEKILKNYLDLSCSRFMNGVVYDVEEYPKFKNAKIFVIDDYVIYTILDLPQTQCALQTVKELLK